MAPCCNRGCALSRTLGLCLSAAAIACTAALGATEEQRINSEIRELQRKLVEAISKGEDATALRGVLRDVREAQKAGDLAKASDLIAASKAGGAPATATPTETPATPTPAGQVAASRTTLASGDLSLGLLVWKPADSKKKPPAVVLVADGFRGIGRTYREFGEFLASKGYYVVAPELRGQGRSGGKVEFLGGEVDDVTAAVNYLKGLTEEVDPERVMLVGAGWGGSVSLLAAGRGAAVKGTAALAAPTDLNELLTQQPGIRLEVRVQGVKFDMTDRKALKARSPLYTTKAFAGECFLVNSQLDRTLPAKQVAGYGAVLTARGITVTIKTYASQGKGFVGKHPEVWRDDVLDFLDKLSGLRKKATRRTPRRRTGGNTGRRRR